MKITCINVIFLFLTLTLQAQKEQIKAPISIYTFNGLENNDFSFSIINKKLNLTNFRFAYAGIQNNNFHQFSIDLRDIGYTPPALSHQDYQRYQDRVLINKFLLKNDPTRWDIRNFNNN